MSSVSIVFPHQLFRNNPCLNKERKVLLVEEYLFFNQYKFHKQKLVFHRASMRFYEEFLHKHSYDVEYISAQDSLSDIRKLISKLKTGGITQIFYTEVVDDWLDQFLEKRFYNFGKYEDAIVWRYLTVHRDFFGKNPRLKMLLSTFDKINSEKRKSHLATAEKFLESI